jgi:ribosomal protein S18 acetylase RimI-like enzyme
MEIRNAKKSDKGSIAELIYSSGADIYDFIYETNHKRAIDYIDYEYKTGRGFCGYKNVTVAFKDDEVIGTGCFYDGKNYGKLLKGTLINVLFFYGPFKFRAMLERLKHTGSAMKRPRENEIYLSNFGVSEKYRGQGIGSSMLEKKIAEAKTSNYKKFILDVSAANPKAEALYMRHGMSVTKTKQFSGQKDGVIYAKTKQMELILNK